MLSPVGRSHLLNYSFPDASGRGGRACAKAVAGVAWCQSIILLFNLLYRCPDAGLFLFRG